MIYFYIFSLGCFMQSAAQVIHDGPGLASVCYFAFAVALALMGSRRENSSPTTLPPTR